jgi:hypothetical protein
MSCDNLVEPGMSALDNDHWLRNLTNRSHVTRDGTVHRQALKKPAIDKNPSSGNHELSGRLRSYAGTIDEIQLNGKLMVERIHSKFTQANKVIPSVIEFVGIAHAAVGALRWQKIEQEQHTDVIYEPTCEDKAHANVTAYGYNTDEDLDLLYQELQKKLKVTKTADIPALFNDGLQSQP